MDPNQYHQIYQYLHQQILPTFDTSREKQKFINFCKNFDIKANYLYKKNKKNEQLIKVIRNFELEPLLYMMHNDPTSAHFSTDTMFDKIRKRYYWPQMYENIKDYIKACDSCQRRGRKRNLEPLQPIPVGNPFEKIGIDFVGPLPVTPRGNKYIIVATDYLTKWPEARPVSEATAATTVKFIYEDIICRHGCPRAILSDRGTHFRNQLVDNLMKKFEIKHLYSFPYHLETNGLTERFNWTLCESLAKTSVIATDWDTNISSVLFAYRTAKQATTKIEPFYLVYGRTAQFPTKEGIEYSEENLLTRLYTLVNKLPEDRRKTQTRIRKQQQKQKEYHNRKIINPIEYEIGDKVLIYDAAKHTSHTGKLNPKWKGPYYIHDRPYTGVYKLRTLEEKVIQAPINGSLLRPYYERTNWVPQVTIY